MREFVWIFCSLFNHQVSLSLVCRFLSVSLSFFVFSLRLECHFDAECVCVCMTVALSFFFVLGCRCCCCHRMVGLHFFFSSLHHLSFFLVCWPCLAASRLLFFFFFFGVSLCTYVSEDERNLCDEIRKKNMWLYFFVCSLASCSFFHTHTHIQQIICSFCHC
jgi:hypothetical protein